MNTQNKTPQLRSNIIKAAVIFIVAFILILIPWLYILESYYGMVIAKVATYVITFIKNVEVTEFLRDKDIITVGLIPAQTGLSRVIETTIEIPTSNYAFNIPLSLSIMAAFYPFIKSKWIYLEAIAILVFVHFLFVFSLEGEKLTKILTMHGYEDPSSFVQILWEFLWGFVDNMVLRFEPFLIGAYLFFMRNRERKKPEVIDQQAAAPKQHPVYRKKKSKKKRR
jgi:hypothetical protein